MAKGLTVVESIAGLSKPEKSVALNWLAKGGPFLDDERLAEAEDYFEHAGFDVTDEGLGEATRLVKSSFQAGVISLTSEGDPAFDKPVLVVDHGLPEERFGSYDVDNVFDLGDLRERIDADLQLPESWAGFRERCEQEFAHLQFFDATFEPLAGLAFYPAVSARLLELLRLLNSYAGALEPDGSRSAAAHELYEAYAMGDVRYFSDEADDNKRLFKSEMTFPDPDAPGSTVFCTWHGKVKSQQFRFHFECPKPGGRLRVFYIGPKLTKR